jgi:hypothetical protein
MSRTSEFYWFSNFESGVTSVEDAECSGYPSTSWAYRNVAQVNGLFHENRHITSCDLADKLRISFGMWQSILKLPKKTRLVHTGVKCMQSL